MYWSWLQDNFIPGVFSGRWYNGQEEKQTTYIGNKHSLLVGMPRIRQLRVKSSKSFCTFNNKANLIFIKGYTPFYPIRVLLTLCEVNE